VNCDAEISRIVSDFSQRVSDYVDCLNEELADHVPDDCLDWIVYTSDYREWRDRPSNMTKDLPVLWCQTHGADQLSTALGGLLLQLDASILHVKNDSPLLSGHSQVCSQGSSNYVTPALFSLLLQASMYTIQNIDLSAAIQKGLIFDSESGYQTVVATEIAKTIANILSMNKDTLWIIFIHDVDALEAEVTKEVARLLVKLFELLSRPRIENLRIVILGEDTQKIPRLAKYSAVINRNTLYQGKHSSLGLVPVFLIGAQTASTASVPAA